MGTLTDMSDADLVHALLGEERKLMTMRMKHRAGQLENTAQLGQVRREIARLHTAARARERQRGLAKDSLLAEHRLTYRGGLDDSARDPGAAKGGFLSGIVDKLSGQQ